MKTLIDLAKQASEIENMLVESCGVITPEIEAMLSVKEAQLPEKVDAYSYVIDRLDALEEFYLKKADEIYAIAKSMNQARSRCRDNIKRAMIESNTDELLGNDYRFKLQNGKQAVVFNNEELIPDAYKNEKILKVVDKERIAEDLKMGIPVPGCHLSDGRSLRQYVNRDKK